MGLKMCPVLFELELVLFLCHSARMSQLKKRYVSSYDTEKRDIFYKFHTALHAFWDQVWYQSLYYAVNRLLAL